MYYPPNKIDYSKYMNKPKNQSMIMCIESDKYGKRCRKCNV